MNRIIISGFVSSEPISRYTSNGNHVIHFSVSVRKGTKRNDDGTGYAVNFFDVDAWEKTAEIISQYVSKGQKIAVEGRIQTRSYDAKDGTKRYATEVVVQSMEFCDSKGGGISPASPPEQQGMFDGSRAVADEDIPF